jgi:SMC interacting uncharacterized protein involved in chromosome segregation
MTDEEKIKKMDEIINRLNDELGVMGNNLIEKQFELDYLKEVNAKLKAINTRLVDLLNQKKCLQMTF